MSLKLGVCCVNDFNCYLDLTIYILFFKQTINYYSTKPWIQQLFLRFYESFCLKNNREILNWKKIFFWLLQYKHRIKILRFRSFKSKQTTSNHLNSFFFWCFLIELLNVSNHKYYKKYKYIFYLFHSWLFGYLVIQTIIIKI